ncbi:MAG: N-acetylmuramoyl-L-alanine amidase-like domain-containing protein [Bdellovibrionota bacterium]
MPKITRKKRTRSKRSAFAGLFSQFSQFARAIATTKKRRSRKRSHQDHLQPLTWILPTLLLAITLGIVIKYNKNSVKHPVAITSAKLIHLFEDAQNHPLGEKVAFWSEKLLKNPNLLVPIGSGPEVSDTAPLFPRGYDCTTYVEIVGALARSESGEQLADRVIEIRYRNGEVSYATRNHFPEADWIPNNEKAGVLKDITIQVARKSGFVAGFVNKDIDRLAWFKGQGNEHAKRIIARSPTSEESKTVRLAYIPAEKMMASLQHIPQGAVINVVRENKARQPVLITHQGFLIWKKGVAYFRHASRNKEITEMPLTTYLRQVSRMPWRVLGFNVNAFQG